MSENEKNTPSTADADENKFKTVDGIKTVTTNWLFSTGRRAYASAPGLVNPNLTWVTVNTLGKTRAELIGHTVKTDRPAQRGVMVVHRPGIVEQNNVVCRLSAQPTAQPLGQTALELRPGQHENDRPDGQSAKQHEQKLLKQNPQPTFFVTGEKKFEGGPLDAPMPKHVDQMNQHDNRHQRQKPEKERVREHGQMRNY